MTDGLQHHHVRAGGGRTLGGWRWRLGGATMICSFTRVPQAWVVTDADADTDVLRWSEWDDLARRSHCRVQRRESAAPLGSSTTPSITLRHQHHHLSPSLHRGLTPPTPLHNGLTPGKEGHATRRPQYVISVPALAPNCCAACCLPLAIRRVPLYAPMQPVRGALHIRSRALTSGDCSRALLGTSQGQVGC